MGTIRGCTTFSNTAGLDVDFVALLIYPFNRTGCLHINVHKQSKTPLLTQNKTKREKKLSLLSVFAMSSTDKLLMNTMHSSWMDSGHSRGGTAAQNCQAYGEQTVAHFFSYN